MRPRGFFGIFGWLLVRLRFAVVLFWAAVALAAYLYLPPIGSSTTSSISEVVPESAPAVRAESRATDLAGSVEAPAITLRGRAATPRGRNEVRATLERLPGISRLLDASDFEALHASGKLGDFVVEAEAPWGFGPPGPDEGSPRGGHGSTLEMLVPLLISGAGVRVGGVPQEPKLVDVAPTIAALLGAPPPADAQGRALEELLNL